MLSCFRILTKNECERKHVASFLLSELQDGTGMDKASSAGKWDQNKCTFQDKVLLLFIKALPLPVLHEKCAKQTNILYHVTVEVFKRFMNCEASG